MVTTAVEEQSAVTRDSTANMQHAVSGAASVTRSLNQPAGLDDLAA